MRRWQSGWGAKRNANPGWNSGRWRTTLALTPSSHSRHDSASRSVSIGNRFPSVRRALLPPPPRRALCVRRSDGKPARKQRSERAAGYGLERQVKYNGEIYLSPAEPVSQPSPPRASAGLPLCVWLTATRSTVFKGSRGCSVDARRLIPEPFLWLSFFPRARREYVKPAARLLSPPPPDDTRSPFH